MSSFVREIIDSEQSIDTLNEDQTQTLLEYAQTVAEQVLVDDFTEFSYLFPKKLFSILISAMKRGEDLEVSSILQYFIISISVVSNQNKIGTFFSDDKKVSEFVSVVLKENVLSVGSQKSEEIRMLVLSFLTSLFAVKSDKMHPDEYKRDLRAQQDAFTENIQKLAIELVPVLVALSEYFPIPVVNLVIAVHQNMATVPKRHNFIKVLVSDYDAAKYFSDAFLAQFNYITLDVFNSIVFIQSIMNLQDINEDTRLFVTNDINFLVDIILREEEKWSETLYAQDEKNLKTAPVLHMYEIRLSYLRALKSITKSKLYLFGKVTKEVHKQKEIVDSLRKVLNEREPNNCPKAFFILKEEALDILDNKCFVK